MKRLRHWILGLLVAFNVAGIGYMSYLAFWPVRTLEVVGHDQILNPEKKLHAGEALVYRISYCKYTRTQAKVTRLLSGPVNYPLPDSTNNIPTGCHTAVSKNTIVPEGVKPGIYKLELTATYLVNPLHSVQVTHNSDPFEVVPRDPTVPVVINQCAPTVSGPHEESSKASSGAYPVQSAASPSKAPVAPQIASDPRPAPGPSPTPSPTPPEPLPTSAIQAIIKLLNL